MFVEIPPDMRERAAGVSVVETKYMGMGRQKKVLRATAREAMDRAEDMGDRAAEIAERHEEKQELAAKEKERAEKSGKAQDPEDPEEPIDPLKDAFAKFPAMLVVKYHAISFDGTPATDDIIGSWQDDSHADAVEYVAEKILRRAELVDETEEERGNVSGVSSAA